MRSFGNRRAALSVAVCLSIGHAGCNRDYTGPSQVTSGPVTLTCSASPTSGIIPLTVTFAVKVSPTPQSLIVQYGDGQSSSNPNALHVYKTAGSFNASVIATSEGQTTSCTVGVTASAPPPRPPNHPPVANFRVNPDPATGPAPFFVAFNACKTVDPDGDRLTFRYDFGDGVKGTSKLCRDDHTYVKGTYNAKVCVTDAEPEDEICRSFLVQAQ